MNDSPYKNIKVENWLEVTKKLVDQHPISPEGIVDICNIAWKEIFNSTIGGIIKIGDQVNLTPQMIGNFLHILIAHHLKELDSKLWRKETNKGDKDIVYIPNDFYSFEIKTSSSVNDIYGNRSYGQPQADNSKKGKDGYYLAVNFSKPTKEKLPEITKIRFGWIEHSDWIAQRSPTGQQCRLTPEAKKYKLLTLHSK
ncbi:MAG: ScaI family restriction endonuclease [Patescibacteria group bacterium]